MTQISELRIKAVVGNAKPRGHLDDWSLANWFKIPEDKRKRCLNHLKIGLHPETVELMREQHSRGLRIGSHDPRFHFSFGMSVRNTLRQIMLDDALPPVEQPSGDFAQNWDDYYMGALQELVEAGATNETK